MGVAIVNSVVTTNTSNQLSRWLWQPAQRTTIAGCQFPSRTSIVPRVSGSQSNIDELVRRCQQGDQQAFTELFHRHKSDVARLATRMLGPVTEVQDIVQDVFLQVFRTLGDFQGKSKFSTWLHRVTVTMVLMHRRSQRSRPRFAPENYDRSVANNLDPDDDVMRHQRVAAFYQVLDSLSEKKRTVFVLHDIQGLGSGEIAQILEIPALTVRTRLFYARRDIISLMQNSPVLQHLSELMVHPATCRTDNHANDRITTSSPNRTNSYASSSAIATVPNTNIAATASEDA